MNNKEYQKTYRQRIKAGIWTTLKQDEKAKLIQDNIKKLEKEMIVKKRTERKKRQKDRTNTEQN